MLQIKCKASTFIRNCISLTRVSLLIFLVVKGPLNISATYKKYLRQEILIHLICLFFSDLLDNVVTFRKADATIRLATFETEPSCDIWFQFKTTAIDGVIMHNTGERDYIKVELASKYIQAMLFRILTGSNFGA